MSQLSDQIVEYLDGAVDGGVCRSIDDLLEEGGFPSTEDLDLDVLDEIDSVVFTCEECGWTMPVDSMSEDQDQVCEECADLL